MHQTCTHRNLSVLGLTCSALLMSVWAWAQPASWRTLSCADPAFSIAAPADWTLQPVAGKGARLMGAGGGPLVEVVAWRALWPPASAEQAAHEHEGLLLRALDYTPGERRSIRTDAGAEALIVTGTARAEGTTQASVFCAYGHEGMHYVVGTFCRPDELAGLRAELFDALMRSFRPGAGAPVEPPAEPLTPAQIIVADPTVTEPTVDTPNGGGRPPGNTHVIGDPQPPPAEVVEPPAWREVTGEAGYTVTLPADWTVAAVGDRVVASRADPARPRAVVWWPVAGRGEISDADLRGMVQGLPHLADLQVLTEVSRREGMVVMRGSGGEGMALLASYAWEADNGLLTAAIAPTGERPELEMQLARIAASWRPNGWTVAAPTEHVDFLGGLITWQLPAGWQSRGGARLVDQTVVLEVEAALEGPRRMRLAWRQPLRPAFRNLTALLESLGWREGEAYADTSGQSGLVVYRRRDPRRFVEEYLLPAHPRRLSDPVIEPMGPDSAIAGLLSGTDTHGQAVVVHGESAGEVRQRLYLVATGLAPPPLVSTCWEAAELRADAPEGHLPEAVAALTLMVNSARPVQTASQSAALSDLIGRARRALRGVPPELARSPEAGVGGADWTLPPGALQYWSERDSQTN